MFNMILNYLLKLCVRVPNVSVSSSYKKYLLSLKICIVYFILWAAYPESSRTYYENIIKVFNTWKKKYNFEEEHKSKNALF